MLLMFLVHGIAATGGFEYTLIRSGFIPFCY